MPLTEIHDAVLGFGIILMCIAFGLVGIGSELKKIAEILKEKQK